jgi:anti-anti-sigma factor
MRRQSRITMSDISTGRQANEFAVRTSVVPGSVVISLSGAIDAAAVADLVDSLTSASSLAADLPVVIDASDVTFLDCAGLQALLSRPGSTGPIWADLRCPTSPEMIPTADASGSGRPSAARANASRV